jgi:hypothetical protein
MYEYFFLKAGDIADIVINGGDEPPGDELLLNAARRIFA